MQMEYSTTMIFDDNADMSLLTKRPGMSTLKQSKRSLSVQRPSGIQPSTTFMLNNSSSGQFSNRYVYIFHFRCSILNQNPSEEGNLKPKMPYLIKKPLASTEPKGENLEKEYTMVQIKKIMPQSPSLQIGGYLSKLEAS